MVDGSFVRTELQGGSNMRKPYLIRTPDFDPVSGGIRVMYGLYGSLLAKGQIVFLNQGLYIPSVGIYPEIYHGNDMNADKVIRWVLQTPGRMSTNGIPGPTVFDETDEIYAFSKVYDQWGLDDDHILFLPIIDQHTFYDQKKKRTKTAYYCARGKNLQKHPQDAIEITRAFATDQQALADLLNECQTLYIYDNITAMMEVARLCGTPIEYWGSDSLETLQKYEPGMNGIGYHQSDVKLDTEVFTAHYDYLKMKFDYKLDKFIDHTQS
jgi:hypothetical protein